MSISVLIPAYKEKEALSLCIRSCVEGCINKNDIEIIVGVDGTYDILEHVFAEWKDYIKILDPGRHIGLNKMTNYLVYQASHDKILLVNDDNVFSAGFDRVLNNLDVENIVWSINQIEPYPSMFKQFIIQDLGRDPKMFDLEKFNEFGNTLIKTADDTGSTLPIFMSKQNFLKIGGWDIDYPGPYVVDWDFFLKCRLAGYEMKRLYSTHMYHFVSLSTNHTEEKRQQRRNEEIACHNYAKYKWNSYIQNDPLTNNKYIKND